jgi:general bacterial porin, GBP family
MKFRNLLLASLLTVAGVAHAQSSNVQIFGVIDQSVVTQKGLGLNNTNINSSTTTSSNIGFRGVEKLGDGYGVGFNLEAGVNLATGNTGNTLSGVGGTSASNSYGSSAGTASVFNRQANLQADVPVGQFLVGRQYTPLATY